MAGCSVVVIMEAVGCIIASALLPGSAVSG